MSFIVQPSAAIPVPTWTTTQTTGFTAVANTAYPVNTSSGAITVLLPATPTAGQVIYFTDYAGTFATNNLTINPNGNKLDGATLNRSCNVSRESVGLVYIDSTQGWIVYTNTDAFADYTVSYLIVAGGGGGGTRGGGGGGAGGYQTSTTTLSPGLSYTVTVGAGGAGSNVQSVQGSNGSNSVFGSLTASVGGGGGGSNNNGAINKGVAGGSGGGGAPVGFSTPNSLGGAGTTGQGNKGGDAVGLAPYSGPGGGGGASAAGVDATAGNNNGTNGGAGTSSSISGSAVTYAGGGGGACYDPADSPGTGGAGGGGNGADGGALPGGNGTANRGGGGGGGGGSGVPGGGDNGQAGNGGSGIVIISYAGAQRGTGGTVTTSGGNTIHTFTTSGTYIA